MAPIFKFVRTFLTRGPRPDADQIRQFVSACVAYFNDGRSIDEYMQGQRKRRLCLIFPCIHLVLTPKTLADASPCLEVALTASRAIDRYLFEATLALPGLDRVHSYEVELGPPPSQAMFNALFVRNADWKYMNDWTNRPEETWYGATLKYDRDAVRFANYIIKMPNCNDWIAVAYIPPTPPPKRRHEQQQQQQQDCGTASQKRQRTERYA